MAIMNKMREKMTVIFAGLAGAFLLMIIFEWGAQGDFFKSGRKPDEIGKVNGISITNKDYEDIYQGLRNQKLQETKKSALSEAEENELREKSWDQVVVSKLIEQKVTEFGIKVTDQEVRDILFYNPPEDLKRGFIDSTGRFHEAEYFQALKDPHNDSALFGITKKMREQLKTQKLASLLQTTIRTTNAEMWDRYFNTNAKATISILKLKPTQSPREFISKVTEDEIKKYYDEHPFLYKRDEARKVKFVVFRELPSPKDSVLLMERVEGLKKKWMALPMDASDSILNELSRDYSDAGYQKPQMTTPSMFSSFSNSEEIVNAKLGDVTAGLSNGQIKVVRVLEVQDTGAMYYHAKNILIGFGRPENKDSAKAIATKIYDQIKAGADFSALAKQYSQDPSARTGGDMRWMGSKTYAPQFEEAAMKAPTGVLQSPIESSMGYHVFEVVARSNRKLKTGVIPVDIKPSSQTSKMAQQQANIFREKAVKVGFDQAAQDQNLRVTADGPPVVKKGAAPMFGYMPWTNYLFELSTGDITQPVRIPSLRLTAVAQVTDVIPDGVKPLDSLLKEQIKNTLAKRKAVAALSVKANQLRALLGPGDDLAKLASVDSAYKPFIVTTGPAESSPSLGTEYAVNNTAFSMKLGEISQPIQGESGYYIIKLIELKPADKAQFDAQRTQQFQSLTQEKQQRFFGQWIEQMKDKATVIDYRSHRM